MFLSPASSYKLGSSFLMIRNELLRVRVSVHLECTSLRQDGRSRFRPYLQSLLVSLGP